MLLSGTGGECTQESGVRSTNAYVLVDTVAGFGATYEFSHAAPGAEVFLPTIVPWVTSFIALTLSTNVVCTSKRRL